MEQHSRGRTCGRHVTDYLHGRQQHASGRALAAGHVLRMPLRLLSLVGCVHLSATPGTAACQAPLSVGFSEQYWTRQLGLSSPPLGGLPDPGIEPTSPVSPALQADPLPLSHRGSQS